MLEDNKFAKEEGLEAKANSSLPSKRKIGIVDTAGNVTYSLLAGSILDYLSGLNFAGILTSRSTATGVNAITGGLYGYWREKIFEFTRTNEDSSKKRKTLSDLLAFNTFQVPIYATAVAAGSLVSEGKVDWNKVARGSAYLAAISPFIGPTLGIYTDWFRKRFGIKSAAEGAYK